MAKVEITLTANYVQKWGVWEGIRELVQNAKDGETEKGARMEVRCTDAGNLQIINRNAALPREALLIGFTTKDDNDETIGQFGEGLKLGTLALVRAGYKVTIYNGPEIWKPAIQRSSVYNADVLCFDITRSRARTPSHDLTVVVEDLGKDYWEEIRDRFVFLAKPKVIDTDTGSLILDQRMKGMVFVKGIYVQQINSEYGYDMRMAQTDRDRRMVNSWDLNWYSSKILGQAVFKKAARDENLLHNIYSLLAQGSPEVEKLDYHANREIVDGISELFIREHGDKAFPVSDMEESRRMSALGRVGVVCPATMRRVMNERFGTFEQFVEEYGQKQMHKYSWHELTLAEQTNINQVMDMFSLSKRPAPYMEVVDFGDEQVAGRFKDNTIHVARHVVADIRELLHTYAHEWAHNLAADDLDMLHKEAMGYLLADIALAAWDRLHLVEEVSHEAVS